MGVTLSAPAVNDKDATASKTQSGDRLGFNFSTNLWHIIPRLKEFSQLQRLVIKSLFENTLVNSVVLEVHFDIIVKFSLL